MARLYADQDFDNRVVERLRQRGHDVVTVQQAGRCGGADAQVLSDATADKRAVLTCNRWDFDRLHRQSTAHAGIVSCSRDDDLDGLADRIDRALAAAGSPVGQHLRVNKPAPP